MLSLMGSKRPLGFWASVGVCYEAEHAVPVGGWRASMPGERIVGYGRTKPLALADLNPPEHRLEVEALGGGFYRLRIYFGFMEEPNIPKVLASFADPKIAIDPQTTTFFLGRQTIIATRRPAGMALWRERLFSRLSLNATTATAYFCIPPERVVELGEQIEI